MCRISIIDVKTRQVLLNRVYVWGGLTSRCPLVDVASVISQDNVWACLHRNVRPCDLNLDLNDLNTWSEAMLADVVGYHHTVSKYHHHLINKLRQPQRFTIKPPQTYSEQTQSPVPLLPHRTGIHSRLPLFPSQATFLLEHGQPGPSAGLHQHSGRDHISPYAAVLCVRSGGLSSRGPQAGNEVSIILLFYRPTHCPTALRMPRQISQKTSSCLPLTQYTAIMYSPHCVEYSRRWRSKRSHTAFNADVSNRLAELLPLLEKQALHVSS